MGWSGASCGAQCQECLLVSQERADTGCLTPPPAPPNATILQRDVPVIEEQEVLVQLEEADGSLARRLGAFVAGAVECLRGALGLLGALGRFGFGGFGLGTSSSYGSGCGCAEEAR